MNTEDTESFADLASLYATAASSESRQWESQLLSPERAQRFELLLHLLANLEQPLVVCGPHGIGKTTVLGLVRKHAFENGIVVSVSATPGFECAHVVDQIAVQALKSSFSEEAVHSYLTQLTRSKTPLLLLLDDAGQMAPGELDKLWRFAKSNPILHLVLALRPDDAHVQSASDPAVMAACHFVDIPPLAENQMDAYLRRLAIHPGRLLRPDQIAMAARSRALYRASHGVPGRIVEVLSQASQDTDAAHGSWLLGLGLTGAAVITVALATYWLGRGETVREPEPVASTQASPPLPKRSEPELAGESHQTAASGSGAETTEAKPLAEPTDQAGVRVEAEQAEEKELVHPEPVSKAVEARTATESPSTATANARAEAAPAPASASMPEPAKAEKLSPPPLAEATTPLTTEKPDGETLAKTDAKETKAKPVRVPGIAGMGGAEWFMAQPPESYTLRVMMAHEPASVRALLDRYPALKSRMGTFRVKRKEGNWYPVYYGVFSSLKEAQKAAAELPSALGTAIPRPFRAVQQEIRVESR